MQMKELFDLVTNFKLSKALIAATSVGIIETLAKQPYDLEQLTVLLSLDLKGTESLLKVLLSAEIVELKNNNYSVKNELAPLLSKNSPESIINYIKWQRHQFSRYNDLESSLTKNDISNSFFDSSSTAIWVDCLAELAQWDNYAEKIINKISCNGVKQVFDLGGGSGIYSIKLCRLYPRLTSIIFEQAKVIPYTRRSIQRFALENRIEIIESNIFCDKLPKNAELILVVNVLHGKSKNQITRLLKNIHSSLKDDGQLVLAGDHLSSNNILSPTGAMLNLTMLLNGGGCNYSVDEILLFLKYTGFVVKEIINIKNNSVADMIIASKSN